jgi:putative ABC transport system permease protein
VTGRVRSVALVREILASVRSHAVSSAATTVIIAGLCALVLLTAGRTAGAALAVLGTLDADGTRSIVIRADPDAGLTTAVFHRLDRVDGIEWVGAFDAADDLSNARAPGSAPVPVRRVFSTDLTRIGLPGGVSAGVEAAFASSAATRELGFTEGVGVLRDPGGGRDVTVLGDFEPPSFLAFLEPAVLVPSAIDADHPRPVGLLVVIARSPGLVEPLSAATASLLGVTDATKVEIETSARLAEIRSTVATQLGDSGHTLVLGLFGLTTVLVAALQVTLVLLRRRDFGRRRALGATRALIVILVLGQAAVQGTVGAVIGTAVAGATTAVLADPPPPPSFTLGVTVLAIVAGIVGALAPALVASRRDPLTELRVA